MSKEFKRFFKDLLKLLEFFGIAIGTVCSKGSEHEHAISIKLPFTPSKVYTSVFVDGTTCVENDCFISTNISYKRVTFIVKCLLNTEITYLAIK